MLQLKFMHADNNTNVITICWFFFFCSVKKGDLVNLKESKPHNKHRIPVVNFYIHSSSSIVKHELFTNNFRDGNSTVKQLSLYHAKFTKSWLERISSDQKIFCSNTLAWAAKFSAKFWFHGAKVIQAYTKITLLQIKLSLQ